MNNQPTTPQPMTDNNRPITPPDELRWQWIIKGRSQDYCSVPEYIATQAARWGYERRGAVNEAELQKARDEELLDAMPVPVPVSERLPGPGDCDAEGRCWWGLPVFLDLVPASWRFASTEDRLGSEVYWLPAHALPMPRHH